MAQEKKIKLPSGSPSLITEGAYFNKITISTTIDPDNPTNIIVTTDKRSLPGKKEKRKIGFTIISFQLIPKIF